MTKKLHPELKEMTVRERAGFRKDLRGQHYLEIGGYGVEYCPLFKFVKLNDDGTAVFKLIRIDPLM